MPEPVFVIRNQHGLYLTRQNEWVDGHDAAPLFKAAFRDIALNTLIELNAKDIELRGVIVEVEVNDKGLPRVAVGELGEAATTDATIDAVDDLLTVTDTAVVDTDIDTAVDTTADTHLNTDNAATDAAMDAVNEDDEEMAHATADDNAPTEQSDD